MRKLDFEHDTDQCIVCGCKKLRRMDAEAFDVEGKKAVSIVECNKCKFAWQSPVARDIKESIMFFESAYEDAGRTGSGYFDMQAKRKIAEMEFEFVALLSREKQARSYWMWVVEQEYLQMSQLGMDGL